MGESFYPRSLGIPLFIIIMGEKLYLSRMCKSTLLGWQYWDAMDALTSVDGLSPARQTGEGDDLRHSIGADVPSSQIQASAPA